MKILFLGPNESPLVEWLKSAGEEVVATMAPVDTAFLNAQSLDFIVSYGYCNIIKRDVLNRYVNHAVNLHISYLPWNRGRDPNFWSLVEGTPKGVTIHYLDEGVDTGDIIAQRKVGFSKADTLRTSYDKLQVEIQTLFKENWPAIRGGKCHRKSQEGKGTSHRLQDKEGLLHLLTNGWDTPIASLEDYAAETQRSGRFSEKHEAESEGMRK